MKHILLAAILLLLASCTSTKNIVNKNLDTIKNIVIDTCKIDDTSKIVKKTNPINPKIDRIQEQNLDLVEVCAAVGKKKKPKGILDIAKKAIKSFPKDKKKSASAKPKEEETPDVTGDLSDGHVTYNIPDTMQVEKTYRVVVRVLGGNIIHDTSFIIDNKSPIVEVKTSSVMQVQVIDPRPDGDKAFLVVNSNSENQGVDSTDYTEWVFNITPIKSGKYPINIIISAIKDGNKKERTYIGQVMVKANPKFTILSFIKENWKWSMTTIFFPLIIWISKKKKKNKPVAKP